MSSSTDQPTNTESVVDLTGDDPILEWPATEVRYLFEHLLDAFGVFTAIRDEAGGIVDFLIVSGSTPQRKVGGSPAETLAEHHKREFFDDFCHVVEMGEPLGTQSLEYEDDERGAKRLVRAFEVRAVKIGDGLAAGWRDVTRHVLMEAELERRTRELTLMGEMVDYLQAVETPAEVFDVAASYGSRLFEEFSGGFFMQSESGNVVEALTSWGDGAAGAQVFAPEDCWALRRGRRHGSLTGVKGPRCVHAGDGEEALLCVPLIVQGRATGLLVLTASGTENPSITPPSSAANEALAVSVCEHLGLALTNIRLRGSFREQSIKDPLTGLFNRRYLEETLEREISRSARAGVSFGLMMMDIDHFKDFNDTFGHRGGDALIVELGGLLRSLTRAEDVACRFGGDEFVALLPESSLDVTFLRAEEIRKRAHQLDIMHEGSVMNPVTLTIGVALYPKHGADMAGLLQAADKAMYTAKHAGGDRVEVALTPGDLVEPL
ncbi:MAG: sensor domain-containing diguanylate cyclase [Acidimicrobiia bacterium]